MTIEARTRSIAPESNETAAAATEIGQEPISRMTPRLCGAGPDRRPGRASRCGSNRPSTLKAPGQTRWSLWPGPAANAPTSLATAPITDTGRCW